MLQSLELFAGAGGLALGTELAGFHAVAAVENDKWACETLKENCNRGHPLVKDLKVMSGDVREIDYSSLPSNIDLVSGGPPCQPFSIGGKHRAHRDDRDMFNAFADVISAIRPRAFLIENVKGLTRASFTNYLQYIELRMSMPDITMREDETWYDHLKRLEAEETSLGDKGLRYRVVRELFNAADFGAPQKRERVFIVGFREDQDAKFQFPDQTHSLEALMRDQWVTGEYWERNEVAKKNRPTQPVRMKSRIERLRGQNDISTLPWRTVREALYGLPEPRKDGCCPAGILNHRMQTGAKVYPGHTGSPVDLPAKALKAGDHGVPGGENMLVQPDGNVRYFTVRESARLQTFPDGYVFHGAWSEAMRQLGNAVPVVLAQSVATEVAKHVLMSKGTELTKRLTH